MTRCLIMIVLSIFLLNSKLAAQKKFKSKRGFADTSLVQVKIIMKKDPVLAIDLLSDKLAIPANKKNREFQRRAYTLLGDINANIEQFDLASTRYSQALRFVAENDLLKKKILLKQGSAFLHFDQEMAKLAFQACMDIKIGPFESKLCKEGLADGLVNQDSLSTALPKYQELESYFSQQNFKEDEIRIQSKMAQLFSQQNNLGQAQLNYQKAYSNANTTPIVRQKDKQAYEQAKEDVIQQEGNTSNEIITRGQNIELKRADPLDQAVERIKLADAYVRGNQPTLALKTLKIVERSLRDIKAPLVKAELNKKLSEVYVSEGDLNNALKSLDRYETERQVVLDEKEEELNQQIAIVKGQQRIDLEEKDYINRSTQESFRVDMLKVQKYIIALLSLLLFIAAISIYSILKNIRAKNKANKMLELKGLRAQMNPHFLFNALNTVNEYIVLQDERKANQYLSDFSALMRLVLENSQKDLISLEEEIEVSQRYLELEHRRFANKFDYTVDIDTNLPSGIMVPPLLFQPYLENAIWHGLRYKELKGHLQFSVKNIEGRMVAKISDNGIGRKNSLARKTKNQRMTQSTGLKNTAKRVELINSVFNQSIEFNIDDADTENETGTVVTIII